MNAPRYYVAVRSTPRGSMPYGRPVYVAVVDREVCPDPGAPIRAEGIVAQWGTRAHAERGRRLDSRYSGPRSAYGAALREATEEARRLNDAERAVPKEETLHGLAPAGWDSGRKPHGAPA